MSDRKETPDILGSVLGKPAAPQRVPEIMPDSESRNAPARRTRTKTKPSPKPGDKGAAKSAAKKPAAGKTTSPETKFVAWEYQDVMFYDYGGYVVRYVGGRELFGWKRHKAGMSEYLNRMGSKGWEVVSLATPKRYHILVIFKRPKAS